MALSFTSTNRVDYGSSTPLDGLLFAKGGATFILTYYKTGTSAQWLLCKNTTYPSFEYLLGANMDGTDKTLGVYMKNLPGTVWKTDANALPSNEWRTIAWSFKGDDTTTNWCRIYSGKLSGTVTECGYTTRDTANIAAAGPYGSLIVGNVNTYYDAPAVGSIAQVQIYRGIQMTADQIERVRFLKGPRSRLCVFFANLWSPSYVRDISGYSQPGTVTGASIADHAPFVYTRSRFTYRRAAGAAPAAPTGHRLTLLGAGA